MKLKPGFWKDKQNMQIFNHTHQEKKRALTIRNERWTFTKISQKCRDHKILFFWLHCVACAILVPWQGIENLCTIESEPRDHQGVPLRDCYVQLYANKSNNIE